MTHTAASVLAKLPDVQVVGGHFVVHRDGKHTHVATIDNSTGTFNVTEDGLALLDAEPKPAGKKGSGQ